MAKFCLGERVVFSTKEGDLYRGRVTRVEGRRRRVVTDSGKRMVLPASRLRRSPDRILILEGRLDRSLRSRREYAPMFQQWLSAYRVEVIREKVHTKEDLSKFLKREGRDVSTRFVHIMAHGSDDPGSGKASVWLTFDKVQLADADVFGGLEGKVIILSCCEVADDKRAMEELKQASGAAAVIGYRITVKDYFTNLAEALLYDRIIGGLSPSDAVAKVNAALEAAGIKAEPRLKRPVFMCV